MSAENRLNKFVTEEIKAAKLFIWLFYIIFLSYDLFYYYGLPMVNDNYETGFPKGSMGIWLHIIVLGLLPVAIYLLKRGNPYAAKYLIFIVYNSLDLISNLMLYIGNDGPFNSANIVEMFAILFTPLFMSKKFFWVVYGSIAFKYIVYGFVLQDSYLLLGLVIFTVLAAISYLFLSRFISYIKTMEKVNEDLRQKEKLALVGQLATSIGHEIRNPLASLKGFTQLQREKFPDEKEFFKIMENEIERINLIVNDLMYVGKPKLSVMVSNNIEGIIEYVAKILNPIAQSNDVIINMDISHLPLINCDENQLKQVFINLIKNAIESMPSGGVINISSKIKENETLAILIEDEGQGIEEEKLPKIGQPFFTTKEDGNGLGLLVTFNIIEKHNGKINFKSNVGKGTVVEINLPMN
ncbi:ATP-binding protein [Pseudoneobacillus rhizosphaerae]|jgi:signal transduction histidine kinase|uniref:histidine kinase n=1 Tax=Pseudoneobacillus rhizosphaerae TaxID=2880968 RepID=A0A9C7LAB2_9BACI|nr:ATP-binding protein [Pseudoneobacillus rhizosphaerae]CAG9607275.1 Adaptive-response sensory-kinase SasA [Pseudoneobacillus rhizosphaerae]